MPILKDIHKVFSNAIEHGDIDEVESLLNSHPELVNHPDWTPPPPHCAILWNQPRIMGESSDLHHVMTLLALMFWGMMRGMFLATTLTSVVKLMLYRGPATKSIAILRAGTN